MSGASSPFGAVVTAMVTPFDDADQLDLDAAAGLARYLVAHGSDGLVVAGTTGEGPTLTDDERLSLFRAVREAVTVPVVGATGTNDTAHSIALARAAAATGVDGVLVVTPYYNRPSSEGIAAHFGAVAEATSLPVMLYDIPVRTGRRIGTDLLCELARSHRTIVAVKDATGDVAGAARTVAQAPAGFVVYCGDDALTLPFLAIGAVGIVSVAAHWAGPAFARLVEAYAAGEVAAAAEVNRGLLTSYAFEATDRFPNPVPAKAACRALGLPVGQCRLPHPPAPAELDAAAAALVAEVAASGVATRVSVG